jgi:hypoxanthine phosphoribosyltransferase
VLKEIQRVEKEAECLYNQRQVEAAIDKMALDITEKLADKNPLCLCVLNGGIIFSGLLLSRLKFPLQLDYIHATRYNNQTSGNTLHWLAKPQRSLKQRVVLVMDDIHDEGITQKEIVAWCYQQKADHVYSAMLVEKQHQRKFSDSADFTGLSVADRYVFGYGMDYKSYLRNSAGIYAVKGL